MFWKKCDLKPFINRQVSQLSGGQQQRVALARALVIEPDILLLDEPLSNLDARLRDEMRNEILRLQREYGITTIYVTHDQVEALTMSDRIAVFNVGNCQQIGTPTEIYNQPVNDFVAEFIGETNLFEVKQRDEGLFCEDLNLLVHADTPGEEVFSKNENYKMSVRPEAIILSKTNVEGVNVLKGKVDLVQFTGESVHSFIKVNEGHATLKVTDLNRGPSTYLQEGSDIYVQLPPDQVRIVPVAKE